MLRDQNERHVLEAFLLSWLTCDCEWWSRYQDVFFLFATILIAALPRKQKIPSDTQGMSWCFFIIWPVRPRAQFPWKTIREKVPYEGRTRRSDRAGKTRTALLEMRTVLLEIPTAKSMRVNDKNNFVAAKVCFLQNESWKSTFSERILLSRHCPMQNYFISR